MTLIEAKRKMLSEHFSLYEMMRSETAECHNINNMPNAAQIENLEYLCKKILEPLRSNFGAIIINSGFRCPELNERVHGVGNSQHLYGEAADIRCRSKYIARKYFDFIAIHCTFDQMLFEYNKGGSFWIHVSLKRDEKNRRMRIENFPTKH